MVEPIECDTDETQYGKEHLAEDSKNDTYQSNVENQPPEASDTNPRPEA